MIWNSAAPLKAKALAWRVSINKVASKINLVQRGIDLDSENQKCVFCKENDESTNHLFFGCNKIYQLWQSIYGWLGRQIALPQNAESHLLYHSQLLKERKMQKFWNLIWISVIWCIWMARNKIVFEGESKLVSEILDNIKVTSWLWIKRTRDKVMMSIYEWISNPELSLLSYCLP